MVTIQEFVLDFSPLNEPQSVVMPAGSEIIALRMEGDDLLMWALVSDHLAEPVTRTFRVYGTGDPIQDAFKKYVATFRLVENNVANILHVFEV